MSRKRTAPKPITSGVKWVSPAEHAAARGLGEGTLVRAKKTGEIWEVGRFWEEYGGGPTIVELWHLTNLHWDDVRSLPLTRLGVYYDVAVSVKDAA